MKANIVELFQTAAPDGPTIATVSSVREGQAVEIDFEGVFYPVAGHLSQVQSLKVGDRVLILQISQGFVVAGRLRLPNESPAPRLEVQEGQLVLEAAQSVRLKAGRSVIEIHADGRIKIDGQQITEQAEGSIRLQSTTIELN